MDARPVRVEEADHTLRPDRVRPELWRNGLGATRELASGADAAGRIVWRISVASLDGPAPFSAFPGIDRLFVALGPVRLIVDGESRSLAPGEEWRFAGEAHVECSVDSPTQALNVMTQRGAARAGVVIRRRDRRGTSADFTVDLGDVAADIRIDVASGSGWHPATTRGVDASQ
ncbi:HutD/Ves family protein [Nocardioides nematodiphilus]|uniref:HutD/Ves family protein n=1 Tax=Nocardioides nematodiphilus TaxID=2849669 RepID=UPI001CD9D052|nr:HutD family protein [Nocardioides nematodiphilus]MCA1981671.1 HutD family protein [Nocardioides nematodiphilus]